LLHGHTNSGVFDTPKLAAAETADEILPPYPQLKAEHIRAALEYAARLAMQ
jgi:uncharacterized protein (DUF433 family)